MLLELKPVSTKPQISRGVRGLLVLTALTVVYACIRMFTGFSFYDDEGSLMLMSRWILDGHAVYRDFNSIYGPFFFLYAEIGHNLIGSASHTASRMMGVVPWVLTCVVAFSYTLRLTDSRAAALAAWLALLRTLAFISAQPGHPHEVAVLLVVALLLAASRLRPGYLAFAGAMVAALVLTKINLGVFAGTALLLVCASAYPAGRLRNFLLAGAGTACVIAPILLMRPLLALPWVQQSCALLTLSILAMVLVLLGNRIDAYLYARHWVALILGFAVCASLVLAWSVMRGASLGAMAQSIFWNNLSQSHTWTLPLQAGALGVLSGITGVILAGVWLAGVRSRAFQWVRLSIGAMALLLITFNQSTAAFAVGMPFVWMIMLPGPDVKRLWPRRVLAAVTVMLSMTVYPVAGSQLRFAIVPLTITATLLFYDAWIVLVPARGRNRAPHRYGRAAMAVLLAGYFLVAGRALSNYVSNESLDLTGTSGIRVSPADRATYAWAVAYARRSCDSLVSFPAMHSIYFWTGMLPPVYPDVDGWQAYNNPDRQVVERRVLSSPRACVLVVDEILNFWLPSADDMRPTLLSFIQENFVETEHLNGFRFLVRRPLAPATPNVKVQEADVTLQGAASESQAPPPQARTARPSGRAVFQPDTR